MLLKLRILHKIYTEMKEELFKLMHARGVEYFSFTTDVWSTNVASHSLLNLTGLWIDENFQKIFVVLAVEELLGSHTGNHICEKLNAVLIEWKIEKAQVHVIVVTQGRVHCSICTHDARPRASADISGNVRFPVLQLICYTSGGCWDYVLRQTLVL